MFLLQLEFPGSCGSCNGCSLQSSHVCGFLEGTLVGTVRAYESVEARCRLDYYEGGHTCRTSVEKGARKYVTNATRYGIP